MVNRSSDAMKALMLSADSNGFAGFACQACNHHFYPPQTYCPACLSSQVGPVPMNGEATVLSTTRIHRAIDGDRRSGSPLHVTCVKVHDGPSLFATADRILEPGEHVRICVRNGLFHAISLSR